MRAREILLWVVVLLLLCLRCATVQADDILRGTAGKPVDDTWTLWHDWRMNPAYMADPGYMPTVWRNLGTEGELIGDVIEGDPYPDQVRWVQILNEPDILGSDPTYWAARYADAYREVKARAKGPTLVGGVSLYSCNAEWLRAFLAELPEDVRVEWLGIHTYMPWLTVTRYTQAAQAMLGYNVPVIVTEAGWLWTHSKRDTFRYMDELGAWVRAEGETLNVQSVLWFVPWDPPLPDYEGWNNWSPATVLYQADGSLSTTGRAWAEMDGWADPWQFYSEELFVPLMGIQEGR